MKAVIVFFCIISYLVTTPVFAQISHGGKPLPYLLTRSTERNLFESMPSFDLQEQLRLDSLEYNGLRNSNRFAYKFITDFTPDNAGMTYTLADGTRIWRLGIRSAGAVSMNLLFTEYELPDGASLFIYDPEQKQVKGSFTSQNNSERRILPVSPVYGEELIIEYQEPAHSAFHGKLRIGEVNHGYCSVQRVAEPATEPSGYTCILPLICSLPDGDPYQKVGRSVVELIVDGVYYCTGSLINNTNQDGRPYLLTASHCLNEDFTLKNPDYEEIAGKIIAFFNYNSPSCESPMRGTEEMSMVSTYCRAINESTDMALLELTEMPPIYYRPYYAGWNATTFSTGSYACIQHPGGATKRFSLAEKVQLDSYKDSGFNFASNSFWHVPEWTQGCTAGGSSGSPLLDGDNRIMGALTGGRSYCYSPYNDYFYSLYYSWDANEESAHQLKHWLAPNRTDRLCDGMDPHANSPAFRLSHVIENGKYDLIETSRSDETYLFGLNGSTKEYAEKYTTSVAAHVYGCYLVTPSFSGRNTLDVDICLYIGEDKPETLVATKKFNPVLQYTGGNTSGETAKSLARSQEHFIAFDTLVETGGSFFVGYRINNDVNFCTYNIQKGEMTQNSTWIKQGDEWIEASQATGIGFNTALFIDPVVSYYTKATGNELLTEEPDIQVNVMRKDKRIHLIFPENPSGAHYRLVDFAGKVIDSQMIQAAQSTWSYPHIPSGIYLLSIQQGDQIFTRKIAF